ncbi:MAG: tRNA uridine-5-carboxymethylaminomethyl(34) synthesis enzyme MnmG [Primorskyibacter sp.]
MKHRFDVVVVGGGHAGCEAAHAAARMGATIALVTLSTSDLGVMSCNPAIGGLGKGHLVREIDALDGIMGKIADKAGIQFRLLNRRKGPAVQGPRAQSDREIYKFEMRRVMTSTPGLTVIEGEVTDFIGSIQAVSGVRLADGSDIISKTVILTSGTFLRGVIHIGDRQIVGGRMGNRSSVTLGARLEELGLPLGRLKTGTPPRLDGATIDWARLDMQPGDDDPMMFSFMNSAPQARQISCGITHTNEQTHDIIRENLDRSAMYGGHIEGIGPRYCPSIEDKIVRFSDKTSHQIFLEPESLSNTIVYPNGISTSLPEDVQYDYVRSIVGLESVEITQPGYAIEYDYVDPRSLSNTLALRNSESLFLAGQINGTTGYEEAAAQGLVAGLNAAAVALGKDPILFSRTTSYIGVMVDDLTLRGVSEPYRMFTSRAEFRLSLRADNADQRLTAFGIKLGCVGSDRAQAFEIKSNTLESAKSVLESVTVSSRQLQEAGVDVRSDGQKRNLFQVLSLPKITSDILHQLCPDMSEVSSDITSQLFKDALYSNYVKRQEKDFEALKRDEGVSIPMDFDFQDLAGLSNELKSKLMAARPETLAQAGRIDGMTPSALILILSKLRKYELSKSA